MRQMMLGVRRATSGTAQAASGYFLRLVCLFAAYLVAGELAVAMTSMHRIATPIWLATGVAIAGLRLCGAGCWPAVVAGALIVNASVWGTVPVAVGVTAGSTAEGLLGAWILSRFSAAGELTQVRSATAVLAAAAIAPIPSSILGLFSMSYAGLASPHPYLPVWAIWWIANANGALFIVPLVVSWFGPPAPAHIHATLGETLLVFASLAAGISFAYLGSGVLSGAGLPELPSTPFLMPGLLWAAFRLRPRLSTLALAFSAASMLTLTVLGYGPLSTQGIDAALLWLQFLLVGIGASTLVLIAAVAERVVSNEESRRARTDAEMASRAKSQFVAAIRHDLGQPLQALKLFLSTFREDPREDRRQVLLKHMEGTVDAMSATLQSLRDLTSVELDLVKPQIAEFRLSDLFAQLGEEYRPQAEKKGLRFRVGACPALVTSDPQLLGRMLRNLLSNAVRYTDKGGILLGCRNDGRGIRIEVWDTGRGIPLDEQQNVFQPFHRAAGPVYREASDEGGGLGLGLSTVQRLGDILSIPVSMHSRVGRGTVFRLLLPKMQTAASR